MVIDRQGSFCFLTKIKLKILNELGLINLVNFSSKIPNNEFILTILNYGNKKKEC